MIQINRKEAPYRRSQSLSSDERQAIIKKVSIDSVKFNTKIREMEHEFEKDTQFNKEHKNRAYGPIFMKNLRETISKMYLLQDCYDSEIRRLSEVNSNDQL